MSVSTFPRRRKPAKSAAPVPPVPAAEPTPPVVPPNGDDSDDSDTADDGDAIDPVTLVFELADVIGMLAVAAEGVTGGVADRDALKVLDGVSSALPGVYADLYALVDGIRDNRRVTWADRVQWRKSTR